MSDTIILGGDDGIGEAKLRVLRGISGGVDYNSSTDKPNELSFACPREVDAAQKCHNLKDLWGIQ